MSKASNPSVRLPVAPELKYSDLYLCHKQREAAADDKTT